MCRSRKPAFNSELFVSRSVRHYSLATHIHRSYIIIQVGSSSTMRQNCKRVNVLRTCTLRTAAMLRSSSVVSFCSFSILPAVITLILVLLRTTVLFTENTVDNCYNHAAAGFACRVALRDDDFNVRLNCVGGLRVLRLRVWTPGANRPSSS
jgi:hypothetical protein